jgi:hypothetical protein
MHLSVVHNCRVEEFSVPQVVLSTSMLYVHDSDDQVETKGKAMF